MGVEFRVMRYGCERNFIFSIYIVCFVYLYKILSVVYSLSVQSCLLRVTCDDVVLSELSIVILLYNVDKKRLCVY